MRATQLGVMVFTRQFHWAKAPGICIRPNRGKANAPHIARIIAPVAVRSETSSKPIKATHMQQEQPRPAKVFLDFLLPGTEPSSPYGR